MCKFYFSDNDTLPSYMVELLAYRGQPKRGKLIKKS
jgi:hypothetical protein